VSVPSRAQAERRVVCLGEKPRREKYSATCLLEEVLPVPAVKCLVGFIGTCFTKTVNIMALGVFPFFLRFWFFLEGGGCFVLFFES